MIRIYSRFCLTSDKEGMLETYSILNFFIFEYNKEKCIKRILNPLFNEAFSNLVNLIHHDDVENICQNITVGKLNKGSADYIYLKEQNMLLNEYILVLFDWIKDLTLYRNSIAKDKNNLELKTIQKFQGRCKILYSSKILYSIIKYKYPNVIEHDRILYCLDKMSVHVRSLDLILICLEQRKFDYGEIYKNIKWRFIEPTQNIIELNEKPSVTFDNLRSNCKLPDDLTKLDFKLKYIQNRFDGYDNTLELSTCIHCEIRLIDYLIEQNIHEIYNDDDIAICISKLSCYPCLLYIEKLNARFNRNFCVARSTTHGTIYSDWSFRNNEDYNIMNYVNDQLYNLIQKELKDFERNGRTKSGDSDKQETDLDDDDVSNGLMKDTIYKNRIGRENPVFELDQQPYIINTTNGSILTTKLQSLEEEEDDDEDKNNVGFEKLPEDGHSNGLFILKLRKYIIQIIQKQKTAVIYGLKFIFFSGFLIFFGFAMSDKYGTPAFPIRGNLFRDNSGFAFLFLILFTIFIIVWEKVLRHSIERLCHYISLSIKENETWFNIQDSLHKFSWILHFLVFITIAFYVGWTVTRPQNYISLIGIVVLILLGTIGSKYPHRIRWKTVFYSFVIQFLLATVVIRFEIGFQCFDFLGKEVSKFIHNADAGAVFVFGKTFEDHFFVFKVTSIIIFLGAVINVLYYLGVMQYVIGKIAWFMQKTLNTTAAESMNAAANIFVGMSEAPLMIMPLVPKMTTSELHSVLVGGFATMAGSVLATFIFFGVPANHLIAASVMAAPGALGFSKLLLPETHQSKTTWEAMKSTPLPEQYNVIDALLTGAGRTLKICGYLIANLIAFISVLHFADTTISWIFNLIRHPEINFQFLLGLIFYPFSIIIGIPLQDCLLASKLIGIKVSLNEFIAYQELGKIRQLRNELILNHTFPLYLNGTLILPDDIPMLWNDSSIVILTYALCGFANFGSMGIALATLGVFAPTRKRAITKIAPRALIAGNMVSLMTASIAGLLYDARHATVPILNLNSTVV
ncbi:unnamed protein product [Adineta steineri]|uniref:Uncharacterized protein n=1 Tax=Adineta steineri TaxID=433720 RepID=A0A815A7D2_9BILA|nr:unnamed protein product [Adineta steineri]